MVAGNNFKVSVDLLIIGECYEYFFVSYLLVVLMKKKTTLARACRVLVAKIAHTISTNVLTINVHMEQRVSMV